ncbi:MAG: hypothetical protein KGH84_11545 [Paracoccaceae bacterium]|nr:hypothetical protein [Paracoccaceae bacterium]
MAPPLWKIRREFVRFTRQIRELPQDLHTFFFATRTYDRSSANKIKIYSGNAPAADRVAVFVIYPVLGLQPSHYQTLAYLQSKGYAVQVVTNLPLTEADRGRLLAQCWQCIERPNFGYDFGAYREGILQFHGQLTRLERLLLINDSNWFPLPGSRDWLDDVEALDVDFAGVTSHFGAPRPDVEGFRAIKWSYSPNHRNFHYGSFALCIRPAILCAPGFIAYWQRLRLANKKKQTVRRGEIGLTQWVLAQGFTHGATLDLDRLDADLAALGTARLTEIVRDAIIPELPRLKVLRQEILACNSPAKADLINFILLAVARQGASYALAPYAIAEKRGAFLKKSPVWLSSDSADTTLRLLSQMPGAEDLLAEAIALRARRQVEKA